MAAKLRHVAIATREPEVRAKALRDAFDLTVVGHHDSELAEGIFLSDGVVNVAVLRFRIDQTGRGLDFEGLHHIGFLVSDERRAKQALLDAGAETLFERPADDDQSFFETKVRFPDGFVLDISDQPWLGSLPLPTPSDTDA